MTSMSKTDVLQSYSTKSHSLYLGEWNGLFTRSVNLLSVIIYLCSCWIQRPRGPNTAWSRSSAPTSSPLPSQQRQPAALNWQKHQTDALIIWPTVNKVWYFSIKRITIWFFKWFKISTIHTLIRWCFVFRCLFLLPLQITIITISCCESSLFLPPLRSWMEGWKEGGNRRQRRVRSTASQSVSPLDSRTGTIP